MSMIKCPECGKEFSDKAAACPNCGCPVSEAIKGTSSVEEQKKAAEQMLAAVDRILEKARKAGAKFETDSDSVATLAKELKITLGTSTARSNTRTIVHVAVKACDALYTSYQDSVSELDQACRPLLLKKPGATAIRSVLGTIQWLNEESKIENNYAINFNGDDLGDAVRAKYIPRPECMMLESLWQAEYLKETDHTEAEDNWKRRLSDHKQLAVAEERKARQAIRDAVRQERELERKLEEQKKKQALLDEQARSASYEKKSSELMKYIRKCRAAAGRFSYHGKKYVYINEAGTVISQGHFSSNDPYANPGDASAFRDVCQVVATGHGIIGLTRNGQAVLSRVGKDALRDYGYAACKSWSGLKKIAGGMNFVVGLRRDGTCVGTKYKNNAVFHYEGEGDVESWKDIVDIQCGSDFTAGLKADGTVCVAGAISQLNWTNVMLISAAKDRLFGVTKDGKILQTGYMDTKMTASAKDIVTLAVFGSELAVLQSNGKVLGAKKGWDGKKEAAVLYSGGDAIWIYSANNDNLFILRKDGTVTEINPETYISYLKDKPKLFDSFDNFSEPDAVQNAPEKQQDAPAASKAVPQTTPGKKLSRPELEAKLKEVEDSLEIYKKTNPKGPIVMLIWGTLQFFIGLALLFNSPGLGIVNLVFGVLIFAVGLFFKINRPKSIQKLEEERQALKNELESLREGKR